MAAFASEWIPRPWGADVGCRGARSPFAGLARGRCGLGMAVSGIGAASHETLEGRSLPPREGGTCMYLMNRTPRVATQELSEWETLGVMEGVYNKAKSEEVGPEMRSAISRACAFRGSESFVKDLDHDMSLSEWSRGRVPGHGFTASAR